LNFLIKLLTQDTKKTSKVPKTKIEKEKSIVASAAEGEKEQKDLKTRKNVKFKSKK